MTTKPTATTASMSPTGIETTIRITASTKDSDDDDHEHEDQDQDHDDDSADDGAAECRGAWRTCATNRILTRGINRVPL